MKISEMISVLEAARRGEPIEVRSRSSDGCYNWRSTAAPIWNFEEFEYRVTPKPREWWLVHHPKEADSRLAYTAVEATEICQRETTATGLRWEIIHVREAIPE